MPDSILIAVDVGNARSKLGLFHRVVGGHIVGGDFRDDPDALPEPTRTLQLPGANTDVERPELEQIGKWLEAAGVPASKQPLAWFIGSVNRPACSRLVDWLREHRPGDAVTLLAAGDLPLVVRLDRPDMVGVDRLLDAVAANHLRQPGRPANGGGGSIRNRKHLPRPSRRGYSLSSWPAEINSAADRSTSRTLPVALLTT